MNIQSITLPTGKAAILPADIHLIFPDDPKLSPEQRRATAYIPWDDKYLEYVQEDYRSFFKHALPHLGRRTTDVHTALSVNHLPFLIEYSYDPVDARVVFLATILHDTGWSKVSLPHIADSLSYSGVALSEESRLPKEQHILMSVALAIDLLEGYDFGDEPLPTDSKRHITEIIRRHDYDAPWEVGKYDELTAETKLVCDADRLWSYTHENFWQDTVRKDVNPAEYIDKLGNAVESYFLTSQAKIKAFALLDDRQEELKALLRASSGRHDTPAEPAKAGAEADI